MGLGDLVVEDDQDGGPCSVVVDGPVRRVVAQIGREAVRAERVTVPLWVSHKGAIDALGPLGSAWRTPGEWESTQPLPPPLNYDRTAGA